MGNFATTVLHRLPRNIILYGFDKKTTKSPFCSSCKHPLKFYEYLPIFSWVSASGTCNYCNIKIPSSYFYLEILGGIFAVICSFLYGGDIENYILMLCFYIITSLAFFVNKEHSVLAKEVTVSLLVIGMLQRTLNDQSIIPWLGALSLAAIVALCVLKDNLRSIRAQQLVHIILPASVWLLLPWMIVFAASVLISSPMKMNFYRKNIILLVLIVTAQAI